MTSTLTPPIGLTINQRNIYMYFLNHRKKYKNTPCYVPRCPGQNSRVDQYLTALTRLEEHGLVSIDRSSANYTGWIMLEPKST
jgi:hypothetical protein